MSRILPGLLALCILALLLSWAWQAPEHLEAVGRCGGDVERNDTCLVAADCTEKGWESGVSCETDRLALPYRAPPFGNDDNGYPLIDYARQGASIVVWPAVAAGLLVAFFAMLGGVLRAVGWTWVDVVVQIFGEILGSVPRIVVVVILAVRWRMMDGDHVSLMPIALAWAVMCAPGAMDEAAAVAERIGGSRFVEALRAHGFSASRIYVHHVVLLNLRPVLLRQAGEVMMQVVFLEIALSYLARKGSPFTPGGAPSFTHQDSLKSWADLLFLGYQQIVSVADPRAAFGENLRLMLAEPGRHAFDLGLGLVALIAIMSLCITRAGRAR
jgi:ABC-type dipeptide/oligopeptide/nickel transport system permease subunit